VSFIPGCICYVFYSVCHGYYWLVNVCVVLGYIIILSHGLDYVKGVMWCNVRGIYFVWLFIFRLFMFYFT